MSEPSITRLVSTEGRTRKYEMSDGSIIERSGGTVAWRNNNPGNLKFEYRGDGDETHIVSRSKAQALESARNRYNGVVDLDQWGNAIFDTPEHGREAKIKLLINKGDMTAPELLRVYSTADYSGKTNHAAQEQAIYRVADAQGLDLRGKRISLMTSNEIEALADGIGEFEGMKVGDVRLISPATREQSREAASPTVEDAPAEQRKPSGEAVHLDEAYAMGIKYDDVKYAINVKSSSLYRGPGVDGKHLEQGYIDCSGWVSHLQNATMREINIEAGRAVFSKSDLIDPGNTGSGGIVKLGYDRSGGTLLQGAQLRQPGALKEGMVIGVDSGKTSHEHWKGIDHIVMVVRNPESGELMASQSTGSKGVHMMPLDDYLKGVPASYKLYATDPLVKARSLIEAQTHGQLREDASTVDVETFERSSGSQPSTTGRDRDGIIDHRDGAAAITGVQLELGALGYGGPNGYQLKGTGHLGSNTMHAVKGFQHAHGLKDDGIIGPKTLGAMEHARTHPLMSEKTHPSNALYRAIAEDLPAGTKASVIANVTMQAMENGINDPSKLRDVVPLKNGDVMVRGNAIGMRVQVDLQAPTSGIQQMSDHVAREVREQQQLQEQQQQQAIQQTQTRFA